MTVQSTWQTGAEEPMPEVLIELQQMVIAFLLLHDAIGEEYVKRNLVEQAALSDWARKHHIGREHALEGLATVKNHLATIPWAHFIHCRDMENEGWINTINLNPDGNEDVLKHINSALTLRPFPLNKKEEDTDASI